MKSKKLFILDNNILFNILDEIKENFNFDLININSDNLKNIENNDSDYLVLSKSNIRDTKNILVLGEFPLKIQELLQIINIQFLKNKFSIQSEIKIGSYKLNLNSREIVKNNIRLNLTERETNLIIFLHKSTEPVKINQLEKNVWDYGSELETHTVETHIYRLRKKIKENFKDENFVISSKKGYLIK